ncbi:hypothetical protein Belba_0728 [Belliella baltica DSM 15883]|uniref:Uncharacterized protein n=1 Tax=Belliella baltica (strain DSM 15883 / CIP 108006 / LMG 21964 / BA134) TaxID=866536 RepID=I3Z2B3_BELBD|nr:hypothetical protein [Belliella baltica]AFL83381.1 hypothetical protein Belba_0728 [Belliella baltica DSM 15883]
MKSKMFLFLFGLLAFIGIGIFNLNANAQSSLEGGGTMTCVLDRDSISGDEWMICAMYDCPDGSRQQVCNLREVIVH